MMRKLSSKNTSGVTGVYWDKANCNWRVRLAGSSIGSFDDKDEAIAARWKAEEERETRTNHAGVHWDKTARKWYVRVTIGSFDTLEDALAAQKAAQERR